MLANPQDKKILSWMKVETEANELEKNKEPSFNRKTHRAGSLAPLPAITPSTQVTQGSSAANPIIRNLFNGA